MSFFTPARRERVSMIISLAGPSGSGKTYSAMLLAEGLAGKEGKIAFLDTEARRGLHYADRFRFDHRDMTPPFRPALFEAAIDAAEKEGYGVLVIDSFSHEYEGEGGIIEWAGEEDRAGVKSPGNWAKPKASHKKLMTRALQARMHLIFCLRAEDKIKIEKVFDERRGREVTAVVPVGFVPICEKRFPYEMTASFMFDHANPGVPVATKLQDQHKHIFPAGEHVTTKTGELLRAWAEGDDTQAQRPKRPAREQLVVFREDGSEASKLSTGSAWLESYRAMLAKANDREAFIGANIDTLRRLAVARADIAGPDLKLAEQWIGSTSEAAQQEPA